ncbi:hypothetical protein MTR_2g033875 [Medicago truncatula]|uniref:Uncharacterized protein n=1 Tax=Medicago truncatula TaxID=3880 RepID=A0A072V5N5_MEDTR|nr:hypothetical protein MTR_2g033875 [Medicago truncatula]
MRGARRTVHIVARTTTLVTSERDTTCWVFVLAALLLKQISLSLTGDNNSVAPMWLLNLAFTLLLRVSQLRILSVVKKDTKEA